MVISHSIKKGLVLADSGIPTVFLNLKTLAVMIMTLMLAKY